MTPSQLELTDIKTDTSGTDADNPQSDHETVIAYGRGADRETALRDLKSALRTALNLTDQQEFTDSELADIIEDGTAPQGVTGVQFTGETSPDRDNPIIKRLAELLTTVRESDVDAVVAMRLTQLGPGLRDAVDNVEELVKHGATVHLPDDELVLDPDCDGTDTALAAFRAAANAERRTVHRQVVPATIRKKTWRGQPPLGFETNDEGILVPSYDYEQICALLEKVDDPDHHLSKRRAASLLGCTRRTITRALDRPEMYNLDT